MSSLDPPVVTANNDLIPTQEHQNVTLECVVGSRPMARIHWEKQEKRIDEQRIVHTQINQTLSMSRLQVQVS